jgi:hypothetical protein
MTYYCFFSYRIFGGAQSGGGETPVERSSFFEHFSRAKKNYNVKKNVQLPVLPVSQVHHMKKKWH